MRMENNTVITELNLPDRAVDILIRQGGYDDIIKKHFFIKRIFPRWPLKPNKVHGNKKFVKSLLSHRSEAVNQHADVILKYVSRNIKSILDIGCGLGLVDIVLYKRIKPYPDIYLLDKDNENQSLNSVRGGFHQRYIFTADLALTRDIFIQNGAKNDQIHFVDPSINGIASLPKIDLILSITSWGFHYPIETYWEGVQKVIHERSLLFIDLRKSQNGFEFLKEKFSYHCIVKETESLIRAFFSHAQLKHSIKGQ